MRIVSVVWKLLNLIVFSLTTDAQYVEKNHSELTQSRSKIPKGVYPSLDSTVLRRFTEVDLRLKALLDKRKFEDALDVRLTL